MTSLDRCLREAGHRLFQRDRSTNIFRRSGTPVAFDQSAGELKEEEKVAGDELVGEEEVDPFLQPHLHGAGWTVIKGGMLPSFVRRPKNSVLFHPCD
jgi:hypothetical protein